MGYLLRGADVIDGTGAPAKRVDVAIADARILDVGENLGHDFEVVDLDGLVLSPGFVDPHTHYDAQILWDADLTPSSWHGVTTVVMGNCGFTIAPTRPGHRDTIVKTLANVEGMSIKTLEAGLDWSFESFPEYLAVIDALKKRLNVACLIGHTALRWYVLGDDATDRAATPAEISRMCDLVREARAHGAVGFSTSLDEHIGAYGKPVPSRAADREELLAIARALGETGAGTFELVLGGAFGLEDLHEIARVSGRPVTWCARALLPTESSERGAAFAAVEAGSSANIHPQFPGGPIVNQVTLSDPTPLRVVSPGFVEILATPVERRGELYRDPEWRARTREGIVPKWTRRLASATIQETEAHLDLRNGPTLGELAAERGVTPFDVLVDLSLADDLKTRFRVATSNTEEPVIEQFLRDPRCMLGLGDGGAHVTQLCDAGYATRLLGHWVRERGALPLELAVWRLTGQPAGVYGLHDRGRIALGCAADLVAFDPARVGSTELERIWDFPNGTDRLVAYSRGIEHVWVNGHAIRSSGADVPDAHPGVRLRPGRAQ
jgi:N-acyl-D-aspartate/D-glutamate deacylase